MIKKGTELKGSSGEYTIEEYITSGDFCDLYYALKQSGRVVVKIVQDAANNDLLQNEYRVLNLLQESKTKELATNKHIIQIFDSFEFDGKQANVLQAFKDEYVSLKDVIKAYPKGIDVRDAVWMFNRILGALTIPHQNGIVHSAIVPTNFLICPKTHNGKLIDWSYAANINPKKAEEVAKKKEEEGLSALDSFFKTATVAAAPLTDFSDKVIAVCEDYESYYPAEVWSKEKANFSIDFFMAANCFIDLVGENTIPSRIKDVINVCLQKKTTDRIGNIFELWKLFQRAIESEYGKRKFREFKLGS